MSNVKISALPTGTIASTDVIPVVKAGVTTGVTFGHTHPESDITNLVTDLAGKAASSHTHAESDVTNLVADLAALAAKTNPAPTYTAVVSSDFTWLNQGGASITDANGISYLFCPAQTQNVRARQQAAPASTPYSVTAIVVPALTNAVSQEVGVGFLESSTNKIQAIRLDNGGGLFVTNWTALNTISLNQFQNGRGTMAPIGMRLSHDGTNLTYAISYDLVNYFTVLTTTKTGVFTTNPNTLIYFANDRSNAFACAISVLSWKTS